MRRQSIEAIALALNSAEVRYLIVGGLAVVAHAFTRFTADLGLVLDPDRSALQRSIAALTCLGYTPRPPVAFAEFADPEKRKAWVHEKGLTVSSLFSPEHPATEIDLFAETPFDFEATYARASRTEVAPGVGATFVGRTDLIEMKRRAGRPRDLEDIAGLEAVGEPGEPSHG